MAYSITKARNKPSRKAVTTGGLVTFDQFYEIVEENVKADLLDGKIIRDSTAIPRHALTISRINTLINNYADKLDLGEVFGSMTSVRLAKYQGPEPDLFFIRKSRLHIMGEKYIAGPPDLCVEVISKSSRKHDRGRKFVLYAEHGVKEYWIIDPLSNTVEFYENQDGEWAEIKPNAHGRLYSKVLPGFWLNPAWFAKSILPPASEMLQVILGEDKESK
jgi:Uma2 family endonuclease